MKNWAVLFIAIHQALSHDCDDGLTANPYVAQYVYHDSLSSGSFSDQDKCPTTHHKVRVVGEELLWGTNRASAFEVCVWTSPENRVAACNEAEPITMDLTLSFYDSHDSFVRSGVTNIEIEPSNGVILCVQVGLCMVLSLAQGKLDRGASIFADIAIHNLDIIEPQNFRIRPNVVAMATMVILPDETTPLNTCLLYDLPYSGPITVIRSIGTGNEGTKYYNSSSATVTDGKGKPYRKQKLRIGHVVTVQNDNEIQGHVVDLSIPETAKNELITTRTRFISCVNSDSSESVAQIFTPQIPPELKFDSSGKPLTDQIQLYISEDRRENNPQQESGATDKFSSSFIAIILLISFTCF